MLNVAARTVLKIRWYPAFAILSLVGFGTGCSEFADVGGTETGGGTETAGGAATSSSAGGDDTSGSPGASSTGPGAGTSEGANEAGMSSETETSMPSTTSSVGTTSAEESSSTTTGTDVLCGPQVLLEDEPVLYWRLGDPGNVAIDETSQAQDGAYFNVSGGVAGVSSDGDSAIELAGDVGSYAALPVVGAFPTTAFTIELWVNSVTDPGDGGLISYATPSGDNEIYIDDPGSLDLMVVGEGISGSHSIIDGTWHHLAATWRSADGNFELIVDGVQVESGTLAAGESIDGGGTLIVGQDQDFVGGGFEADQAYLGRLDELVIYDVVLPASRIEAHRQAVLCD